MDSELEAIIQTYAYAKCQEVYKYCEEQYERLEEENKELKQENLTLKRLNTNLQKRLKQKPIPYDDNDYLRLRELCTRIKQERDYYKSMIKRCS